MDPRKRKDESLKHDRRNSYGENDKSSRKAIRKRKQWVNQTFRRKIRQTLTDGDFDSMMNNIGEIRRRDWKKSADLPLAEMMRRSLELEIRKRVENGGSEFLARFQQCLLGAGWDPKGVCVVMRQFRSIALAPWSCELELDLPTARELVRLMMQISSPGLR